MHDVNVEHSVTKVSEYNSLLIIDCLSIAHSLMYSHQDRPQSYHAVITTQTGVSRMYAKWNDTYALAWGTTQLSPTQPYDGVQSGLSPPNRHDIIT